MKSDNSNVELDYKSQIDLSYLNEIAHEMFGRPTKLYRTLKEYTEAAGSHKENITHAHAKSLCELTLANFREGFRKMNQDNNLPKFYDYKAFALLYVYLQRKGYITKTRPLPHI